MDSSKRDNANNFGSSSIFAPGAENKSTTPSSKKPPHRSFSVIGSNIHKSTSSKVRKPFKPSKSPKHSKPQESPCRKTPKVPAPSLIRIYVNNRLGTKFDILCSPTDSIGDFKKIVAVYSGTKAEAILLKRQGMRPFSDRLSLEEYEIGNGSSLDMEVDTGS